MLEIVKKCCRKISIRPRRHDDRSPLAEIPISWYHLLIIEIILLSSIVDHISSLKRNLFGQAVSTPRIFARKHRYPAYNRPALSVVAWHAAARHQWFLASFISHVSLPIRALKSPVVDIVWDNLGSSIRPSHRKYNSFAFLTYKFHEIIADDRPFIIVTLRHARFIIH